MGTELDDLENKVRAIWDYQVDPDYSINKLLNFRINTIASR